MEYIVFLITIQFPFCYLIWKFFQVYGSRMGRNLRDLHTQTERLTHMVDTFRLSLEKSTDDIYRRVKKMEAQQDIIKSRLFQLEKYTGLRSNISSQELSSSVNSLQQKDFS